MIVSVSLGPTAPSYRASLDSRDADRLRVRFVPSPGRRLLGLVLGAGASVVALEGLREDEAGAIAAAIALGAVAVLTAFFRSTLVLDRRRERIETLWGAPLPFARFIEARGPFGPVVLSQLEEVREVRETTTRTTTYPVAILADGRQASLRAFPTWEAALDFAEIGARFLGVGLRDDVRHVSLPKGSLDEPLARSAAREPTRSTGRKAAPIVRWNGEDEMVVEVPRPGRPLARRFLGLLVIVGLFWTPLALCGGALVEAFLPLLLIAAAGVKLCWGYGATVVANERGLTVDSRGLVLRRRTHVPLAELESLLLLQPEWGGPRNLLAEFFEGVLVARSDRASVRFGHGLTRPQLVALQAQLTQLFVRLGRTQELASARREGPAVADRFAPVFVAWFACGIGGTLLGPPASTGLALPVLSVWLNVLGVSGALLARWLTRRTAPLAHERQKALALVAVAGALWLSMDLFPGWIAADPASDLSAFWTAVRIRPGPAARGSWLGGLGVPQALAFYLLVLGVSLVASWAVAALLVPVVSALARRMRGRPAARLPLLPARGGVPPPSAPASRRAHAPALLASLALLWSAALFPGAWRPLGRARERAQVRQAADDARRAREWRQRQTVTRRLLRLEMPPPGHRARGRAGLWYFADYTGEGAALVEHLMWLRQAYAHTDLGVVGFPADVHGDRLESLLHERGWYGDHAADEAEAAAYRAWAGFPSEGAYALLLNADGTVRDRLALPWETERRLADWLGPPVLPRPERAPVEVDLRWTYAGHPVALPGEGTMSVLARDAWDGTTHVLWFDRRGLLPRESVPLAVHSGTWHVRLRVSRLAGGRWIEAFEGYALAPLAAAGGRRVVEIPLQASLSLVTPAPGDDGFPEWPAYPAESPFVLSWTEAPEADRYLVTLARKDAPESAEPRRETVAGSRSRLAFPGLPPGRYEVTVEARRGDLLLGTVEVRQGRTWRQAFGFELVGPDRRSP